MKKSLLFLRGKLAAALHGIGSGVFITGAAGVGKTRLVRELRHHAAQVGCQWFGGKYERTGNYPYAVWVDILKDISSNTMPPSWTNLSAHTQRSCETLSLEATPGTDSPSNVTPQNAEIERTRLFEAWTHLFLQMSKNAPLVLFLDDVQWASSLELLQHLARNIGDQRVLALVAYRDDELKMNPSPWKTVLAMNRERLFHPLPLEPLEQKEVAQLISQKVEKTIAPHLADVLYQRTRGNPFFVEEFCDSSRSGNS